MEGYVIYQGHAKIKTVQDEEKTEQKATTELNQNKTKMQNSRGKGGMAIAITANIHQFVTKVEHVNARIAIIHNKTKIQGKQRPY